MAERLSPGLIAEIACSAASWDAVEREVTPLLLDAIGGETAFFADQYTLSEHVLGVVAPLRDSVAPLWPELGAGPESLLLLHAALGSGGAVIDVEVLGRGLERIPYYDVMMRPVRGRSTVIGLLSHAGRLFAKVAVGRCAGSSPFTARHREQLDAVLPTLSLACAAHDSLAKLHLTAAPVGDARRAATPVAGARPLTRREREVLDFLRLGYTNEQIGIALGTRARTVRNQLSRVYDKLGVATRAEAVAACFELDRGRPRG